MPGAALATLGFCLLAGVVPVFNAEVYLAILATRLTPTGVFWVGLAAGLGQTAGKIVWYAAAARGAEVGWLARRLARVRSSGTFERWRARLAERPAVAVPLMFASGLVGLPPLVVSSVFAGMVRMNLLWFSVSILVGRSLQSWAILAGVVAVWH